MNRKQLLCLLACVLCLALLLAGCGKTEEPDPAVAAENPGETTPDAAGTEPEGQETVISDTPEAPAASQTPAEPAPPVETQAPAQPEPPVETQAPAQPETPTEPETPVEPQPTEQPQPTAAPSPDLPIIRKHPTDETVWVGGECSFATRFENAIWAEWHFVSPDGQIDLTYLEAQERFPYMVIDNGEYPTMTLIYVPTDLNGWRVYCRYSNRAGYTDTQTALITVIGG